ncbi:response regulator transcription factor [Qipengyuania aquimaris]|uniref:response regulator transcription factor n=1 Tax=Qipengyuania aquimaris TaxID=255984 RepID=UPI0028F7365D|nr:LuxR C-terminal-related transcriptional regulator [Qipengyuania aquimaris]
MVLLLIADMVPAMQQAQVLHIVDGSSRSRAEQARKGFELGLHCEVYSDAAELLAAPPQRGVVLARDDEGEGSAQEVISTLATLGEWVPVVATSVDPRPTKVVEAIKCGALDYLRLPLRDGRLMAMVARINEEADAFVAARRKVAEARNRIATLSPREREVLDWLAEGRSNKMIARELSISPRTVEIHRANMMSKLSASHSAEAVRLRIEANLTTSESFPIPQT